MKLLIAALMFCGSVYAQTVDRLPKVECIDVKDALKLLNEKYGEKPVWIGKTADEDIYFMMLVNMTTQSWSMVRFDKKTACLIDVGQGFQFNAKNVLPGKNAL